MSGEKTEEPTEKKLQDARKKGQLPQRKNVLEALLTAVGVTFLVATSSTFIARVLNVFDVVLVGTAGEFENVLGRAFSASFEGLKYSLTLMCGLAILVLLTNLILTKFNFATAALEPKFEKLNPINGLKGIFSKNTLYNFFRMLIIFAAFSAVFYAVMMGGMRDVLYSSLCGVSCVAGVVVPLILKTVFIMIAILLVLAVLDYKTQTAIFKQQNKMTKDEIKREFKGSEGDPQIKGARKRIAQEDLVLPSRKDVTHVVFSPTIVVALLYVPGQVPFLVFKAKGGTAGKITRQFRTMGVPCVNLPRVASTFYSLTGAGNYMDHRSGKGMAEILAVLDNA